MAYPGGTIVNPSIPFNCPIPGGLQNGMRITVQGTCHHHQNDFGINLCMTPQMDPLPDTAFCFNVRFHQNAIVRNTQQYNSWGQEERGGGIPFHKGAPFEIVIMVEPHHYKVSINGRHFTNYKHRVAKESAQYLVIVGEVNISYIKFEGGAGQPVYNPPVPYTVNIPGGLYPGRMINISGMPLPNISRFTVNLMCGPSEQGDIGFCFDARFNYGGVYNQTVRTHKAGGTWGTEERHQNFFPFTINTNFDMIILVEPSCIKVAVNNQHFTEFNHRIQPLNRIDYLCITGDVRLNSVRVQ